MYPPELSAEGAKRGVETPSEVFPPNDLPRPSRPKAGLGLVLAKEKIPTFRGLGLIPNEGEVQVIQFNHHAAMGI